MSEKIGIIDISENKFSQLLNAETMCQMVDTFYSNFERKSKG